MVLQRVGEHHAAGSPGHYLGLSSMENQPTADPSAIRFTKQERKLLMQAMAIIEHYGQLDRPELKAKIDALTEPKKGS